MKYLLIALFVICLVGCDDQTEEVIRADRAFQKKESGPVPSRYRQHYLTGPSAPNAISEDLISKSVQNLESGELRWVSPDKILVFPDLSCAVPGRIPCWPERDNENYLQIKRLQDNRLVVVVPKDVKNVPWLITDYLVGVQPVSVVPIHKILKEKD